MIDEARQNWHYPDFGAIEELIRIGHDPQIWTLVFHQEDAQTKLQVT
jgi:hypothetical protein